MQAVKGAARLKNRLAGEVREWRFRTKLRVRELARPREAETDNPSAKAAL